MFCFKMSTERNIYGLISIYLIIYSILFHIICFRCFYPREKKIVLDISEL